jgi:hypothetical protein
MNPLVLFFLSLPMILEIPSIDIIKDLGKPKRALSMAGEHP